MQRALVDDSTFCLNACGSAAMVGVAVCDQNEGRMDLFRADGRSWIAGEEWIDEDIAGRSCYQKAECPRYVSRS